MFNVFENILREHLYIKNKLGYTQFSAILQVISYYTSNIHYYFIFSKLRKNLWLSKILQNRKEKKQGTTNFYIEEQLKENRKFG